MSTVKDTISTVELIYKAFQEKPIRVTYSTKKLEQQFGASESEVKQAKQLFKLYSKDYTIALTFGLQRRDIYDDYEEPIEGVTYSIPASKAFDVLTSGYAETRKLNDLVKRRSTCKPESNYLDFKSNKDSEESEQWEVKQKWVKGPEGSQLMVKKESTDYKKEFLDFVNKHQFNSVVANDSYQRNLKLAVVCLFDIHLGKVAHFKYTGNTDNLKEQEESYKAEFGKLLSFIKSQSIFEIILPIGNDLLNVDNVDLGTSKRTPQSNTSDLHGMFELGLNLMTETINSLAQLGCKVNVVLVPGNHATMSETYLALALDQVYKNDVRVDIDHSPNPRKYYQWGKVCLGFAHGELPLKKYAELFPHEAKEFFSSSNHFEMLVGDKHIEEVHKNGIHDDGVIVRRLAALTKTDSWHHQSGYTLSKRRSYVLIYDKENGLEIQYTNCAS